MVWDILLNAILFLLGFGCCFSCFFRERHWDAAQGVGALRYFTVLSNLLCAFCALAMAIALPLGVPRLIWCFKYVGTVAVSVTLVTVLVFLGPSMGYGSLFKGRDFFLHLVCPLLAIVSFCGFEHAYALTFPVSLWGVLPTALYGALYLYRVVLCKPEQRWEDFYGFNRGGKWPVSVGAMLVGTFVLTQLLRLLFRVFGGTI